MTPASLGIAVLRLILALQALPGLHLHCTRSQCSASWRAESRARRHNAGYGLCITVLVACGSLFADEETEMPRLPPAFVSLVLAVAPVMADTAKATCQFEGTKGAKSMRRQRCDWSQSQGHIVVVMANGTTFDFMPHDDDDNHTDANGNTVVSRDGLGDAGLQFETSTGLLSVYW
jgi:hypothetical protein